jgi:precorrin-4 C11-methyltransferase
MSKVYFVGAGPGDPELITIKGRRLLDEADLVIYAGSLVNPALLAGLRAEVHDSAGMTLEEIVSIMVRAAKEERKVVRLHTGDTAFYSAISEQIEKLRAEGIESEVIPGVTSAGAAAAALGQEFTIPEISQSVIFTRMEGRTPVPEEERLSDLARHRTTMVIFLSVSMIDRVRDELISGGYPEDTPVAVVEKASWPEERIVRGTLKEIAESVKDAGIVKTALIIVGDALKASEVSTGRKSKLYDERFRHGYRNSGNESVLIHNDSFHLHSKSRNERQHPRKGKLFVTGIGPGGKDCITPAALDAIRASDVVVGYNTYIELIRNLLNGKEIITTGMTKEIQRCSEAISRASEGHRVSLVCSGDPGIYAMAGLVLEIVSSKEEPPGFDIEIIPGIPALSACASRLGAPLMHDFVSISLSDRLTPWDLIERRLHSAGEGDFVTVIYNPRSRGRRDHLKRAVEIILEYRSLQTPVGIVRSATRYGESVVVTTLEDLPHDEVDMQSTVIIGNSQTFVWKGFIVTPRGYGMKYSYSE